ncbi:MAG: deoxyuridine 5'-triphosphate nucleotidohydrolase [Chloroflexota bacterium]
MEGLPTQGILDRATLLHCIAATPPLVEGLLHPEDQVQVSGIDLTLRSVAEFATPGRLGVESSARVLSQTDGLPFADDGWLYLCPGSYLLTYNEVVHLPKSISALAFPRSSLLRCGVSIHNAVWDAGYEGRSQSLMVVYNKQGFYIARDARILQLVFFVLSNPVEEGYGGAYQRENL